MFPHVTKIQMANTTYEKMQIYTKAKNSPVYRRTGYGFWQKKFSS